MRLEGSYTLNSETQRRQAVPMKRQFARSIGEEAAGGQGGRLKPQRGLTGGARRLNPHPIVPFQIFQKSEIIPEIVGLFCLSNKYLNPNIALTSLNFS